MHIRRPQSFYQPLVSTHVFLTCFFSPYLVVICAFPTQGLLEEADEEKKRLQGENEMLKALMKKEVDRLDSELAAKANVVDEYKRVVKQLSQKVDAAERRARHAEGGEIHTSSTSYSSRTWYITSCKF